MAYRHRNGGQQQQQQPQPSPAANPSNGGSGAAGGGGGGGGDLYKQLIDNNDLVRELDDIEAISQQISQHAEVLYQSWKNNQQGDSGGGGGGGSGPPAPVAANGNNGHGNAGNNNHQHGGNAGMQTLPTQHHQHGSAISRQSTAASSLPRNFGSDNTSPVPYAKQNGVTRPRTSAAAAAATTGAASTTGLTSPSYVLNKTPPSAPVQPSQPPPHSFNRSMSSPAGTTSSNSGGAGGGGKSLELLVTPEVNGNLKELVNSFVSTDRAKQAARITIANTINSQRQRAQGNNFFRSPSPPHSQSPLSSRAVSPLRSSPMVLATAGAKTNTYKFSTSLCILMCLF